MPPCSTGEAGPALFQHPALPLTLSLLPHMHMRAWTWGMLISPRSSPGSACVLPLPLQAPVNQLLTQLIKAKEGLSRI